MVSQWISSPFWPLLFPNGVDPANFVVEYVVLPNSEMLILPRQSGTRYLKACSHASPEIIHFKNT